ncbi:MAG: M48 family metallopeptidase [Elusimicrobiaceae bacterium]|nr:M48 family metallopeptidase [Elusimicrobiaceae bacterium]
MATTYDFIAQNKRRTWLLVLLFPITFAVLAYGLLFVLLYLTGADTADGSLSLWQATHALAVWVVPSAWAVAMLWIVISYFSGDHMLLRGAGAIEIHKKDQPEIYRLVENLCISQGLPVPRIYIINDESLNAFATGRDPQHASVALTVGIVKRLERAELEGVIAHELSHIKNRDIRLMLITVAGISFCTFMSELCFRMALSSARSRRRSKNEGSGALLFVAVGLFFLIYGYLIAPLIRLAVSRTREYQADASAALMTRNPGALARALEKITQDPTVEVLDAHASMAAMCIANPLSKKSFFTWLSGILATHPPVEKRIAKLREMDADVLAR